MDDLVEMEIVHSSSDAHGPVHQQGRVDLPARSQHLVELALGAVLHDNAVTWSLGTNTPRSVEKGNVTGGFFDTKTKTIIVVLQQQQLLLLLLLLLIVL